MTLLSWWQHYKYRPGYYYYYSGFFATSASRFTIYCAGQLVVQRGGYVVFSVYAPRQLSWMYYCATGRETELSTHAETRWALGGTAVTSCAYLCHGQCNPIMQQSVIPTVGLSKKIHRNPSSTWWVILHAHTERHEPKTAKTIDDLTCSAGRRKETGKGVRINY